MGTEHGPVLVVSGLYEPFNYTRRIVGFDTFEGFPSVDPKDGSAEVASVGAYWLPKATRTT